jgi:hypothetical protein
VLPEVIEYYFWDEVSKVESRLWAACQAWLAVPTS